MGTPQVFCVTIDWRFLIAVFRVFIVYCLQKVKNSQFWWRFFKTNLIGWLLRGMHTSLGGQNGWWPDGSLSQVILDGQCLAPHSNGAGMGGGAWAVGAWLAGSGHSHGKNASKQQENDGELHCAWSGGQIELIWFQSEHLALYRCHRCNKRFE